jgi:outer membrane protein assembly factor BamD
MAKSIVLLLVVTAVLIAGCGSSDTTKILTVEERFEHAKALYDNHDYLMAVNEFTVITLQYQGSAVAPDAQFYLGECRYQREEYLLAAFEYSVVKRNYPASPRVADAMYKTGMSYYNMAPKSALDQQYTRKAIDEFQNFIEYYPANPNGPDADVKIHELTNRLAKKQYDTAKLYATMEYYRSAIFYYDDVIEKYHDTDYAPLAYVSKVELLMSRNKYKEAATEVERFLDKYPNSVLRGKMDTLKKDIDRELPSSSTKGESGTGGKGTGL